MARLPLETTPANQAGADGAGSARLLETAQCERFAVALALYNAAGYHAAQAAFAYARAASARARGAAERMQVDSVHTGTAQSFPCVHGSRQCNVAICR